MPSIQVAVCGPRNCTPTDAENARMVGKLLAEAGATVLCGGGTGVMAAAAEGASSVGGLVIGIRPDTDRDRACKGLSATLFTNMGEARNAILIESAAAVVVVGGSWGTLSELALAHRRGDVPVVSLGGWQILDAAGAPIDSGLRATTPQDAVILALSRVN